MPEDCIVSYEYKGSLEETSRDEIHDLYGLTSYLENFGKRKADVEVVQSAEFKEASEDLDMPIDAIGIGGADYGLFS